MDKRYDHLKYENEAREIWEKHNAYKFNPQSKKEIFSIDTPPPTVSGTLHTGHIFSYTHTDIIARFKRMQDKNVFYPMGFDDNGLPTERYVEKKHKIKASMLKRSEFIKLCLNETKIVEKEFEKLWKTVGLSIDWSKTYSTISKKVRKISQYSFIDLFKKNLVYRKQEPSLYCTTCQTSVAQAELDDAQISSTFNDLEFKTEKGKKLIIATTRPELLPACVAIFYHPEDQRYKHLKNKLAIVPIFNQKIKILPDEKVEKDKGTGLVMCCTFGDQTDIYWYKKYKLPFIQAIGFDGKLTKNTGPLEGLKVHQARKRTIELLQESGKLLNQKKINHNVNVHERCKQEIEYLILRQWFVKILDNKKYFLEMAEKIEWKPKFMKARYRDWVENLGWDWCISRQRFFGIPFPVWHCQNCEKVILADPKDLPVDPQEKKYSKCPECSSNDIKPDTDVMDTWNTSALTPEININWPENNQKISIPMSIRPQAHDIIRTWAFYTIVKAKYHLNKIPWNEIVISGHILAGKEKVSKSKQSGQKIPTPEELLKQYPADAVRYWAANGKLGMDTAFSENQLKIGQRLITKLWNAFRFCKQNLESCSKTNYKRLELDNLNKWLLHKFSITLKIYLGYFEKYDYTLALETAEKFFWHDFCDNYLELIKYQIFNPDKYKENEIAATRFVLYEIGFGILQLFAPFTSHITEILYQKLFKNIENIPNIHSTTFDTTRYSYNFSDETQFINKLIMLITICRKLKTEKQLSLKTELKKLILYSENQNLLSKFKEEEKLLKGITKANNILYKKESIPTSLQKQDNSWIMNILID
ncbi:valine--tRNA ligase [Candidatus Dependentiae bacterium]|nr:valine--tRNA ligase [Candidatus Dependentiae bacterium]